MNRQRKPDEPFADYKADLKLTERQARDKRALVNGKVTDSIRKLYGKHKQTLLEAMARRKAL